jgi:hypothetical protein
VCAAGVREAERTQLAQHCVVLVASGEPLGAVARFTLPVLDITAPPPPTVRAPTGDGAASSPPRCRSRRPSTTCAATAVARTLFRPTTLSRAIDKLGFVQADPIRAPARAQDLILRHRVAGYRAGDLERRYRACRSTRTRSSTTASCRAAIWR